ncbi:MAG: endonuclease domain-containing protein [SAR324 cluster bacterium]|nr:endonuclease domain-containing protein [SAR324 cluster bacterium]
MRYANHSSGVELWSKLKPKARQMRQNSTTAEELLWEQLRGRQIAGYKFRRQHAINRFILDFYCPEAKLAIEVDGPIHLATQGQDSARAALLTEMGVRLLRFRNEEVSKYMEKVREKIITELRRERVS